MIQTQVFALLVVVPFVVGNILRQGHTLRKDDVQELLEQLEDLGNVENDDQNDAIEHQRVPHSLSDEPLNIQHKALNLKEPSKDVLSSGDRICKCDNTDGCYSCQQLRNDRASSVDQIADMLDHLEEELGLQINEGNDNHDHLSMRCRCSDGTDRCGCPKLEETFERNDDFLRCKGNRCSGIKDRKGWSDSTNLRCRGNRCNIADSKKDNDVPDLLGDFRCSGDRCGKDQHVVDVIRQSISRDYDSDDNGDPFLRCKNGRCGVSVHSDRDDHRCGEHSCDLLLNKLRCTGPNCNKDDHNEIHYHPQVKKFKINDNLDAMVMDITQLDKLLNKLGTATTDVKVLDMEKFGNLNTNRLIGDNRDGKLKAVVVDLSKIKNAKSFAKRFEDLMHPERAYNHISDDYIFDDMSRAANLVASNQQRVHEVQKLMTPKIQPLDVKTDADIMNLLQKALGKVNLRGRDTTVVKPITPKGKVARKLQKQSLLPMTVQQKTRQMQKLHSKDLEPQTNRVLRDSVRNMGFPFELKVQALGQVNPGQD